MKTPFSPSLRGLMLVVDLGFLAYWAITAAHLLPAEALFKDYDNPILQAWNWSFLPLDLFISASGLSALALARRGSAVAPRLALVSLTFTSTSGLMAIAFWVLRADYSLQWWLPNLALFLLPLPFLAKLLRAP